MTKIEMRRHIRERKQGFQGLEKRSAEIVDTFQTLECFLKARRIGAYIPLPDEVDITPLFQCLEKQFYIPAFDAVAGSYRLAEYTGKMKSGKFGIPEPANPVFAPEKLDLIIVPGVAFDRDGNRLGRGGGFYDRLLPQYRATRVGICFDFQCLEEIKTESHDCRVDVVVSG